MLLKKYKSLLTNRTGKFKNLEECHDFAALDEASFSYLDCYKAECRCRSLRLLCDFVGDGCNGTMHKVNGDVCNFQFYEFIALCVRAYVL